MGSVKVQGTFLAKEENKVTFASAEGKVVVGYVSGPCTLVTNTQYVFDTEIKMSKHDKPYTVISGITGTDGKPVAIEQKKRSGGWSGGGGVSPDVEKSRQEGLARGNYRTGLMALICTHYQMSKTLPDVALLQQFNEAVKAGERNFFSKVVAEKPTTVPGTEGLIK